MRNNLCISFFGVINTLPTYRANAATPRAAFPADCHASFATDSSRGEGATVAQRTSDGSDASTRWRGVWRTTIVHHCARDH